MFLLSVFLKEAGSCLALPFETDYCCTSPLWNIAGQHSTVADAHKLLLFFVAEGEMLSQWWPHDQ